MSQKQKVVIGGVVGVAFIIAFGLFSFDAEVEYDLSNVDFVICDTSIGALDPTLTPEEFAALDLDALGCVEYFLVHMVCDHDFETDEYHGTYAYEPDTLTIPVGKTVVWRNDDIHRVSGVQISMNMSDKLDAMEQREFGGTHDVTFDLEHNGVLVQSPTIHKYEGDMEEIRNDFNLDVNVGVTGGWAYTFLERGDFPYHCSIHPWMTGTVHVV